MTEGQTVFTLINGTYEPNSNRMFWYWNRVKQENDSLTESSSVTVTFPSNVLSIGDEIIVEYIQLINSHPYPIHASEHLTNGVDSIPVVTTLQDGLMAKEDKIKLDSAVANSHSNYTHNQITPLSTWNIIHNLNRYPNVTIVDSAGNLVITDIKYISENEVQSNSTAPFGGKAHLS